MSPRPLFALAPLALLLAGCVTEPTTVTEPPWEEPPVKPYVEPAEIEVERWLLAFPLNDTGLFEDVQTGRLDRPSEGGDENGVSWTAWETGENGAIGNHSIDAFYAVPDVDIDPGQAVIARTMRSLGVYRGRRAQPGYFYNDREPHVPLVPDRDDSIITVRGLGRRGDVEAQLYTTDDEIWLNQAGASRLDLVVGETREAWWGIPLLNLTEDPLLDVVARVVENEFFEATVTEHLALPPAATTQVPFLLRPKVAPGDTETTQTLTVRVASPSLEWSYERSFELSAREPTQSYWETFRSPIDGSVQSYGVLRPSGYDPSQSYGAALSLHGAAVQARGQSNSYSAKPDMFIIAPTNRHRFGFDWEEWGRFNALATLDDAMGRFPIDETRVHLTGHSMGGHGTWHVGVTTPGRFATVTPSAGWESFYSYGGSSRPSGAFGRARAHSDTLVYLDNLARRGAYVIHGDADDNVPVREGRDMFEAVSSVTDDAQYHEQPGAGHWWDANGDEPGADCVDWEPAFAWMQTREVDPLELDFAFTSPMASYAPHHSYVTLESPLDPNQDLVLLSESDGASVTLSTTNVRSMTLDGAGLLSRGVSSLTVDGETVELIEGPIQVGPADGKNHQVHGPWNQVFRQPFCFVYSEEERVYAHLASYLSSYWTSYAAGHACAVAEDQLTDAIRDSRNLIWLGVAPETVGSPLPISWDADEVSLDGETWSDAALLSVTPRGDHLDGVMTASGDALYDLYGAVPFSSRSGLPDYMVWSGNSARATGFWDGDWE